RNRSMAVNTLANGNTDMLRQHLQTTNEVNAEMSLVNAELASQAETVARSDRRLQEMQGNLSRAMSLTKNMKKSEDRMRRICVYIMYANLILLAVAVYTQLLSTSIKTSFQETVEVLLLVTYVPQLKPSFKELHVVPLD
ncbi:hypothetical protein KIPB_009429, partial [Kipferlia bialata]